MKTRKELIFASIIIGYLLAVFSLVVYDHAITSQNTEPMPSEIVTIHENGTIEKTLIQNVKPTILTFVAGTILRFSFALPFAIAGLGLVSAPIGFLQTHLFVPTEGFRVLVFWIIAMITIPINYMFTKDIPLWRRIPYIYLLAAIISGTPMLLNENFGR